VVSGIRHVAPVSVRLATGWSVGRNGLMELTFGGNTKTSIIC